MDGWDDGMDGWMESSTPQLKKEREVLKDNDAKIHLENAGEPTYSSNDDDDDDDDDDEDVDDDDDDEDDDYASKLVRLSIIILIIMIIIITLQD